MAEKRNTPETRLALMEANSIAGAGTEYSDPFFLKNHEFFSMEWLLGGATQFDAVLQMLSTDGTWLNATSGSALVTNSSAQRGFVNVAPPFSVNTFRIAITNDDAGAQTFTIYIHRGKLI